MPIHGQSVRIELQRVAPLFIASIFRSPQYLFPPAFQHPDVSGLRLGAGRSQAGIREPEPGWPVSGISSLASDIPRPEPYAGRAGADIPVGPLARPYWRFLSPSRKSRCFLQDKKVQRTFPARGQGRGGPRTGPGPAFEPRSKRNRKDSE